MSILFIILGVISILYDILLISLNPGTFLDILFSFSHIWLALGGYLIFVGVYRIKTGHSFWQIWKKWIKITFGVLFGTGLLIVIINLILILTPTVVDSTDKADYVILLGGGIDKDGKLPESVMARVDVAAEYLKKNPEAICVVTGGTLHWLPYAEAPEIRRQLISAGISEKRILVEDQAKDTIQNFQLSCKVLEESEGLSTEEILSSSIAVVTSHYHLRRAERLARRMGFKNIKGISAACPAIYVPHSYVREICAYVKLNLRILLTGEPKRLSGQARQ